MVAFTPDGLPLFLGFTGDSPGSAAEEDCAREASAVADVASILAFTAGGLPLFLGFIGNSSRSIDRAVFPSSEAPALIAAFATDGGRPLFLGTMGDWPCSID